MERLRKFNTYFPIFVRVSNSYHTQLLSSRSCDQDPADDLPDAHLDPEHFLHHLPGCVLDVPHVDVTRTFGMTTTAPAFTIPGHNFALISITRTKTKTSCGRGIP